MTRSRRWDEIFIGYLFYPHDVEDILKMCIQSSREGDFIAWHYEKNRIFSAKSANRLALNLKDCKEIGDKLVAL